MNRNWRQEAAMARRGTYLKLIGDLRKVGTVQPAAGARVFATQIPRLRRVVTTLEWQPANDWPAAFLKPHRGEKL